LTKPFKFEVTYLNRSISEDRDQKENTISGFLGSCLNEQVAELLFVHNPSATPMAPVPEV
jgi:hypothetical protein